MHQDIMDRPAHPQRSGAGSGEGGIEVCETLGAGEW